MVNPQTKSLPSPSVATPTQKIKIANIPYWEQEAGLASIKNHQGQFDFVSLFWYYLDDQGQITNYQFADDNPKVVDDLKKSGTKVLVTLTNLPDKQGDWDPKRVGRVLGNPQATTAHIEDILTLLREKYFDGVNIDYENLNSNQRESFSRFIESLADKLHKQGKVLQVSLHPKVGENKKEWQNGSQAQDWIRLGKVTDQLVIMAFDQHSPGTNPGPIASVPWVENILNYALTLIPQDKIFLALPLFGYDYTDGESVGFTLGQIESLIKSTGVKTRTDSHQNPYFSYKKGEVIHKVWYEDKVSLQKKIDLVNSKNLGGVSIWHLGNEGEAIYHVLGGLTPTRAHPSSAR